MGEIEGGGSAGPRPARAADRRDWATVGPGGHQRGVG
jgi:hypothetical protein